MLAAGAITFDTAGDAVDWAAVNNAGVAIVAAAVEIVVVVVVVVVGVDIVVVD